MMFILCSSVSIYAENITSRKDSPVFPAIKSNNLNRDTIKLPQELEGKLNLMVIGFQREQQDTIDTWIDTLDKLEAEKPDFKYYEIPLLSRGDWFMKPIIDNGMRGGIPSIPMRKRVITLYTNKNKFKKSLQIPHEDTIYLYLITKEGSVIWESTGEMTASKVESLRKNLEDSN
ncbi:MAG: hypothetical protein K2X66_11125 [Cyanobacteria bacterium]|nr:hypothetical protein [Cyanobacteriota bacterium]